MRRASDCQKITAMTNSLETLTVDVFQPRVGQTFRIRPRPEQWVEAELIEARALGGGPTGLRRTRHGGGRRSRCRFARASPPRCHRASTKSRTTSWARTKFSWSRSVRTAREWSTRRYSPRPVTRGEGRRQEGDPSAFVHGAVARDDPIEPVPPTPLRIPEAREQPSLQTGTGSAHGTAEQHEPAVRLTRADDLSGMPRQRGAVECHAVRGRRRHRQSKGPCHPAPAKPVLPSGDVKHRERWRQPPAGCHQPV